MEEQDEKEALLVFAIEVADAGINARGFGHAFFEDGGVHAKLTQHAHDRRE